MDMILNILSAIGSICSIIGIPIAIMQAKKAKDSAEASKEGIKNFLILDKNRILSNVIDIITEQTESLNELRRKKRSQKEGYSNTYESNQCNKIIAGLNTCICNLPAEYGYFGDEFKDVIVCIEKFIDTNDIKELSEARSMLYKLLNKVKSEKDKCIMMK